MMIRDFAKRIGGTLTEQYYIGETEGKERITADGLIVFRSGVMDASSDQLLGRNVVVLYAVEGIVTPALVGRAAFGMGLLQALFQPSSLRCVILCTEEDPMVRTAVEKMNGMQLIIDQSKQSENQLFGVERIFGGISFHFICNIEPVREHDSGRIREYYPEREYRGTMLVHKYGTGPFCTFSIPTAESGAEGVFVITVDGEARYIGSTEDLYQKFFYGFGHIQPRDCFTGGHPENCRINRLILGAVQEGLVVRLFFAPLAEPENVEAQLIKLIKPKWNIHGKRADRQRFPLAPGETLSPGKWEGRGPSVSKRYRLLSAYLSAQEGDELTLSFARIEEILGHPLPPSALKYVAWWSNGSQTQAMAWLSAGWRVKSVRLGESILFRRFDR